LASCADALFIGQGLVFNPLEYLRPALDFVLPERCPSCSAITPAGGTFCVECWQKVHFLGPPWCVGCAVPLPFETDEAQYCATCLTKPPIHDGIRAVAAYGDATAQVAVRLKHGGKIGLAKMIAQQLARHVPLGEDSPIIVPVPLHWTRLWARSYNQSALIGSALAKEKGLKFIPDLLLRNKRTPLLRGMSQAERRRTVNKAFTLNPKWHDRLSGAHIILVDDVYTTGATANACIKVLKKGGADWVQIFCWARVLRGEVLPEHLIEPLDY
jgi:ComF family protein